MMKFSAIRIIPVFILAMLITAPVTAQTTAQTTTEAVADVIMDAVFGKEEKRIIDDYILNRGGLPGHEKSSISDDDDEDHEGEGRKHKKKHKKAKKGKGKNKQLPPGLAKRKELPPGLRKRLEKHRALPPGLAVRELPEDLVAQLPPPVKGTDRIVVEDDIVLIEKATGRILDIILGRGTN